MNNQVVVIGGGVMGSALAYWLTRLEPSVRVTVVEISAGLNKIVFQGSGDLPSSFTIYPTFLAHALLATILANLIVLHALAALYHQFVRKDSLFRRMFFRRRAS
jgi:cytochrome b561